MPPNPTPTAPQGDANTQYYRQVLHDMIDLGADFARLVHAQAQAQAHAQAKTQAEAAPPTSRDSSNDNARPTPADLTVAFDRIVRAVRRTILLARTLDAPPRPQQAPDRQATRRRIIRAVEDAIHINADPADADALHAEFQDRLDTPEFEDDMAGRPIAEIINDIRNDLNLDPMPGASRPRRTPADIAALHARAAAPPGTRHPNPPGPGRDPAAPLPFRPPGPIRHPTRRP